MNKNQLHLKNNKKFFYSLITKECFDEEFFELLFELEPQYKKDLILLYKSQMVLNYDAFIWFLNNLNILNFSFFKYHLNKLLNLNIDVKKLDVPKTLSKYHNANNIEYGFRANYFNLLNTLQLSYLDFFKSDIFLKYISKDISIIRNLLFIYSTSKSLPIKFFSLYKSLLRAFCKLTLTEKELQSFTYSSNHHHALHIYLKYNKPKFSINSIFVEFCRKGKLQYLKSLEKHNIDYKHFHEAPLKAASINNKDYLVVKYLISKGCTNHILEVIQLLYLETQSVKNPLSFNNDLANFLTQYLCKNHWSVIPKLINDTSYIKEFRSKLQYEQFQQEPKLKLGINFNLDNIKIKNKI